MDLNQHERVNAYTWRIEPREGMHVPAIIYATEELISAMDHKVYEQLCNVARLPGIVNAAYAMPDAHWGYGFPIGGVAAFDPDADGVISAGGVGFDISCGVRCLHTGLSVEQITKVKKILADQLYRDIPAGLGSTGRIHLQQRQMDAMLTEGARWAVKQGYGNNADLAHTEERGCMPDADPSQVSDLAKQRQRDEMGTLGSGNHYLEVQKLSAIYDEDAARTFGLQCGEVVVSIHCGSRGLGHQIGTEFLKSMVISASQYGIRLPDRELACAPIRSSIGERYLGAMRAGINCALANRQILTHLTRQAFTHVLPESQLDLIYDVSHNTCKEENHILNGQQKRLFVHRKGATRAFGPGHRDISQELRQIGQPVIIGGSMGTASYILCGTDKSEDLAFSSACHGAGRAMSRNQARKRWSGRHIIDELGERGILIRSPSMRGIAEEAPHAYKDVEAVVNSADQAGLARKVAKLEPMICIKG